MSKNVSVHGLLIFALAHLGCSSSAKSGLSGDGSASGPDSAGYPGSTDVPASDVARGGQGDSARPVDGMSGGDLGRIGDSSAASKDVGGQETGTAVFDAPRPTGDAPYQLVDSRLDRDGPSVVDAPLENADLATPIADALATRDVLDTRTAGISDLRKMDTYKMGTPVCDLGPTFKMPSTQTAVPDNYGVCMPPAGKSMSDVNWHSGMPSGARSDISRDGLNTISKIITCTEMTDAESTSGGTAGAALRLVIAVEPFSRSPSEARPQRLFAIYEDPSGTIVQAVYDLEYIKPEYENKLPPYPERYLKISPACDGADALPVLKGWTGRIGSLDPTLYRGPDSERWTHQDVVLWGSAEGERDTKALWFSVERAP